MLSKVGSIYYVLFSKVLFSRLPFRYDTKTTEGGVMEMLLIGLGCGFVIGYAFGLGIHKLDIWERTRSKLED